MSEEKKLNFNDLLPGDILVMHAERAKSTSDLSMYSILMELILLLTDSDVLHGAIFYENEPEHLLIDDAQQGVGKHKLTVEGKKPAKWYVRRLKSETDLTPVLARADFYNNRKTAYDWELLAFIGLLLVFKKSTPDTDYYKALLQFFKKLAATLDQVTHDPNTDYFTCSQFIATCFAEAGQNYELKLYDENLQSATNNQQSSLLELFGDFDDQVILTNNETPVEHTDLLTLCLAVSDHQQKTMHQEPDLQLKTELQTTLIELFKHFLRLHQASLDLQASDFDTSEKIISIINKLSVDFVTPADLKSHCTNLEPIGVINFVYH